MDSTSTSGPEKAEAMRVRSLVFKKTLYILGWVIAIIIGVCSCTVILQKKMWEDYLRGPFYGTATTNGVPGTVTSKVRLNSEYDLAIFHSQTNLDPVLCLMHKTNLTLWSRMLVPVRTNADLTIRTNKIERINLKSVSKYKAGYKVHLICDWDGGGIEGGIIYLSPKYEFRHFALSW